MTSCCEPEVDKPPSPWWRKPRLLCYCKCTMPGRSGRTCAVVGCHNSSGKLQILKKSECSKHKPLLWKDCPCLTPFGLHRFPGRAEDAAVRQQWIENINRKDFVPNKNSTVCGIHFVDGKPTKEHPYPVLHLGYERHEERELPVQSEEPMLPSQLNEIKQEDTAATQVEAPVVWSLLTVKEEERELPVQSENPMLPSQLNEIKQEDTAAPQVKAPVVWSPLIVKAAVSKLSGVQDTANVSPPVITVIKQEEGSDLLPMKTVAWSPLAVQPAVNKLPAVQHGKAKQPKTLLWIKRNAGKAFRVTISPNQSSMAPPVTQQVTSQATAQAAAPVVEEKEIKVVQTGSHQRSRILKGPWNKVGMNLMRGRFKRLPKNIMNVPGLKDIMVDEVLKVLDKECETLASLTFNSVLREKDPMILKDFRWEKVIEEWKTAAPTFLKFLQHASKVSEDPSADQTHTPKGKSLPMAMGGALLLRARSSSMCAPMYINSMILQQGGTKKKCFDQLNRVGVCVPHRKMQRTFGNAYTTQGSELARWGEEIEETEEMDITSHNSDDGEEGGSIYEEGDSDVPEITYIVS
ncbi:uncharacterized protein LOC141804665 isoform X2 [Halichoeres trimaculatus]|uniref:uncharacterized protein LOC141804665 isoform X2 n=1 Tax=Halichoeres trimaculatus TaxID=147232 RepID=UPI003D9F3C6B